MWLARLCSARTGRSPVTTLALPWRIAEIDGDHGLSCRSVAAEAVGLETPLPDCGNRRPAQNKISPNNFQILYAAIAPNYRLQYHRPVKLLGYRFGWIHWIHDVNQQGARCFFTQGGGFGK